MKTIHSIYFFLFAVFISFTSCNQHSNGLREGFVNPPLEARSGVMWHWMNGFISKDGIRKDFIDLHEKGIQKVELFNANMFPWQGPVRYGTDNWHEHIQYALHVADSLGMEFIPMMGDGWATAGGPWNTPEKAMKKIVWSSTEVKGGAHINIKLSQPHTELNYYRDVAVIAIPAEKPENNNPVRVYSSIKGLKTEWLIDNNPQTIVDIDNPRIKGHSEYIEFDFGKPFTASMLSMNYGNTGRRGYEGTVMVSDDGKEYHTIRRFDYHGQVWEAPVITVNFPMVTARYYRVVFNGGDLVRYVYRIADMEFSNRYRIDNYHAKTARAMIEPDIPQNPSFQNDIRAIPLNKVLDISSNMSADGMLAWNVPEGNWKIMRFGYTAINRVNHPATEEGTGLECDKMDSEAIEWHFEHTMGRIIREAEKNGYKSLCGVLLDSNESGPQTWTAKFPEEFRKRKEYDIIRYLPALAGHVLGSEVETECFLWDYRRIISDLVTDNFYGKLAELVSSHGLKLYTEPYGAYFDHFRAGCKIDVPTCEFWNGYITNNSKFIASIVHTTGRNVVAAEAYTAQPVYGSYMNSLHSLKMWGDKTLAEGVNMNILHSYVHQPYDSVRPGFTLSRYGTHFNTGNTWWKYAGHWLDYLASCQYMLQQGKFAADICYLNPSDLAEYYRYRYPECPAGYDFDICNDQLLQNMEVTSDGCITLNGMRYRLLALQDWNVMSLDVLRALHKLVSQGAIVTGTRPSYSPSLKEYKNGKAEFDKLAGDLWRGDKITKMGKGSMWNGIPVGEVLSNMGIDPDFSYKSNDKEARIDFIHRTATEADIYFIANQTLKPVSLLARFRDDKGRRPEIWNPVKHTMEQVEVYAREDKEVIMPLNLTTHESLFIVFMKGEGRNIPIHSISSSGKTLLAANDLPLATEDGSVPNVMAHDGKLLFSENGIYDVKYVDGVAESMEVNTLLEPMDISEGWEVTFPLQRRQELTLHFNKLASWDEHVNEEVKYFSGTAVYRKKVNIKQATGDDILYFLSLERLYDIADIRINGKKADVIWTPPYYTDITPYLHQGENDIEISVTNTWVNRLIGDEQLPSDLSYKPQTDGTNQLLELPDWLEHPSTRKSDRRTFGTWKHYRADSPLKKAGLEGKVLVVPVKIMKHRI